jgi:flagellar biosynthetic protein FlhB
MAERTNQPTQEPTPRRWEKAFEDGEIAFSSELIGGLIVLFAMFFFLGMGSWFFDSLATTIRERMTFFEPMIVQPKSVLLAMRRNLEQVGLACLGLMMTVAVATVVAGALQTRFNVTFKPLELKWNRISPQNGLKKIFSTRSLNRGLISIAKTVAIVVASYYVTIGRSTEIAQAGMRTYGGMLGTGASLILSIGFTTAILMVVIGLADLGFQIWKHRKDLMMTTQEVKDENKENIGDPQIKARIRRLQNELSRKRVVQEVPKATVVITNPTHYAVALKYDPLVSRAPVVIAKGSDYLARQIIEVAKEHGVAVVERKPVARFLYANVKVGSEIPYELYQSVAEILNFIRELNRAA